MDTTKIKARLNGRLNTVPSTGANMDVGVDENVEIDVGADADAVTNASTSLSTTIKSDYIALHSDALSIINENLKNQPLSHGLFDIIKSPSGGRTAFTVPGLSGDAMVKELTGIILDYSTPRAYWDTPDPVEGTPPICFSRDSLVSFDGKVCNRCVYNQFGSKDNGTSSESNGKACKESVLLYLLRPDNILPLIVRVPVSSKGHFLRYATRLVSNLTPISGVVTKITLEKTTNKTGQPYALYNFEAVGTLSKEEAATAKAFGQNFMDIIDAVDVEPVMAEVAEAA